MIEIEDYPNVDHWRTVQEFTIEQASLLLAGIDPMDLTINEARNKGHARWKNALGYARGMETSIRRGILTAVVCYGEKTIDAPWDVEIVIIRPTDRTYPISIHHTIITRESLYDWAKKERVRFFAPIREKEPSVITVINSDELIVEESHIKLLPTFNHKSDGLELVEEAITELWSNYDEKNPDTAPTKKQVIDYLRKRGASINMAEAIDLILRPFDLRKKGRPRKNSPTNNHIDN
ncbi:hypothetical protein KYI77_11770 [Providencia rettgeri]|uniref:Uncharacterized protein n=1 Tax=Providencia rettgeri TaxID=587 RepID=A0AAE2ZFP6_PRORE|nr:hypothetical protein [Providencia huaxiensis]MBW3117128.1 hypothetical protein [Providencia rettgeri]NHN52523.1 hypothetical protein [Providencia rettgeri]